MTTQILNQARLKALFNYNPDTGVFIRRMANGRLRVVGSLNHDGYVIFYVDNRRYLAHRLVWLYVHGGWPENEIDHINRDKADNRIINLRQVTRSEQCQNKDTQSNNTSGVTGVSWHKNGKKWRAHIKLKGIRYNLGSFCDINEAIKARKQAELKYHTHRSN
jgi:hypothetical protein